MRPLAKLAFYVALGVAMPVAQFVEKEYKRRIKALKEEAKRARANHENYSMDDLAKLVMDKQIAAEKEEALNKRWQATVVGLYGAGKIKESTEKKI